MTTKTDTDSELEPWEIPLRPGDRQFVREFLTDMNAYQACIRMGVTPSTAKGEGTRKMRRPPIAKAIAQAMQERAEALSISAKMVLVEAFRCYLACVEERSWSQAAKFLEMVGRHVDVKAFKERYGGKVDDDDDDDADAAGLRDMSLEELEEFARLSRKARGAADEPEAPPLRH